MLPLPVKLLSLLCPTISLRRRREVNRDLPQPVLREHRGTLTWPFLRGRRFPAALMHEVLV